MSPEIDELDNRPWVPALYKGHWVRMLASPTMLKNGILEIYRPKDWKVLKEMMSKTTPEVLDPNTLSYKEVKDLCWINGFHVMSVTGQTPEELRLESSKRQPSCPLNKGRCESRKVPSITEKDFKKVYKELVKIDGRIALIVKILWVLNCRNGKSGSYITLEELLRLEKADIIIDRYVEPGQEDKPIILWVCLNLRRSTRNSEICGLQYILPRLWKPLLKQLNENSVYVFSNKRGEPLHPQQVDKLLKEAGERVGIKGLTSLALRPTFDRKQASRATQKHRFDGELTECLHPVTQDEVNALCIEFPLLRPERGRKPSHSLLDILNALINCFRTGCSIKKLLPPFPPASAVESQKRRWEKSGVFDKIFNWLIAKRREELKQRPKKEG